MEEHSETGSSEEGDMPYSNQMGRKLSNDGRSIPDKVFDIFASVEHFKCFMLYLVSISLSIINNIKIGSKNESSKSKRE